MCDVIRASEFQNRIMCILVFRRVNVSEFQNRIMF